MKKSMCPCGSMLAYSACCGPFHRNYNAPTALQLMKSRYTAFTKGNIEYIEKTMQGPASVGFNFAETKKWANSVIWLGLEIIKTYSHSDETTYPPGVETIAYVEFKAKFHEKNSIQTLHELSEFHFINGQWFYINGKH